MSAEDDADAVTQELSDARARIRGFHGARVNRHAGFGPLLGLGFKEAAHSPFSLLSLSRKGGREGAARVAVGTHGYWADL